MNPLTSPCCDAAYQCDAALGGYSCASCGTNYKDTPEFDRVAHYMEQPNSVFVFGSNLAGRHGGGAAFTATAKYGAVWGRGKGLQGRSYAFPTMDAELQPLRLYNELLTHTTEFRIFAELAPDMQFVLTRVGCGIARLPEEQMRWLFETMPTNVLKPIGW